MRNEESATELAPLTQSCRLHPERMFGREFVQHQAEADDLRALRLRAAHPAANYLASDSGPLKLCAYVALKPGFIRRSRSNELRIQGAVGEQRPQMRAADFDLIA